MELTIALKDQSSSADLDDLERWLRRSDLDEVEVQRSVADLDPDDLGGGLGLLAVVLAGPATIALVKSIHVWLTTRPAKTTVVVTEPSGRQVSVTTESLEGSPEAAAEIAARLTAEDS